MLPGYTAHSSRVALEVLFVSGSAVVVVLSVALASTVVVASAVVATVVALPSASAAAVVVALLVSSMLVVVLVSAAISAGLSSQPCSTRATTAIRAAMKITRKDIISESFANPFGDLQTTQQLSNERGLSRKGPRAHCMLWLQVSHANC